MKKLFTLFTAMIAVILVMGQSVQRNQVVLEIGTGTWCTYCPGAANGAHDLLANGCHVAVIENHNGDAFANTYSNARNTYYGITGYPTAFFDGVSSYVGGQACPNGNVYSSYLPLYQARYAVLSPLLVDISGTNNGNNYSIVLSIKKVGTITSTDMRVHFVVTESNITTPPWPGGGGCMTEVDHVNRLMVPNENGTVISFGSGDMQIITLNFTKDPTWVAANCEFVAFIQDNGSKESLNGSKVALTALPPPVPVNFTGTPTTGCAPLNVSFTDQSVGVTNWQWAMPGGTPSTSTVQNPSATYSAAGSYDVTLTAWNNSTNRGNKAVKPAYITLNAIPGAASQPGGPTGMCINPSNTLYSTTGATNASTYTWDLSPASAGTLIPAGLNCTVDWSNTFTGQAQLKVQGVNACGTGTWSPVLTISISDPPGPATTPSGPAALCINPPNSDYATTGGTPATAYQWELTPADAGAIYPNWTSCTVDWVNTWSGTALLRVKPVNNGCEGSWTNYLTIVVDPGPNPYNMTGGGIYCAQGGTGVAVGLDGSQTGINYTLYLDNTATSTTVPGTGSAISFGNQTGVGTYTTVATSVSTTCSGTMPGAVTVATDPQVPNVPADPTGPTYVNSTATPTSSYSTTGGTYASTYTWELSPTGAGTIAGTGTTGTATWNPSFMGTATIQVKGNNSCGSSALSNALSVTVDNTTGIGDPSGKGQVRLYPNPAREMVTIVSPVSLHSTVQVFNSLGAEMIVRKDVSLSGKYPFDISGLGRGVYFISITGPDLRQILKLVVE